MPPLRYSASSLIRSELARTTPSTGSRRPGATCTSCAGPPGTQWRAWRCRRSWRSTTSMVRGGRQGQRCQARTMVPRYGEEAEFVYKDGMVTVDLPWSGSSLKLCCCRRPRTVRASQGSFFCGTKFSMFLGVFFGNYWRNRSSNLNTSNIFWRLVKLDDFGNKTR